MKRFTSFTAPNGQMIFFDIDRIVVVEGIEDGTHLFLKVGGELRAFYVLETPDQVMNAIVEIYNGR